MVKATVTAAQFEALKGKMQQEGLVLTGNAGTACAKGVTAAYRYDGQQLQIQVTKHPVLVTAHYCESEIAEGLRGAGLTAEVVG